MDRTKLLFLFRNIVVKILNQCRVRLKQIGKIIKISKKRGRIEQNLHFFRNFIVKILNYKYFEKEKGANRIEVAFCP